MQVNVISQNRILNLHTLHAMITLQRSAPSERIANYESNDPGTDMIVIMIYSVISYAWLLKEECLVDGN